MTPPEELGCLTGGPVRAAEVALASLLDAGLVRVSREGLLTAVHVPGLGPRTPLEAYVLTRLRAGRDSLTSVLRAAAASPEAADVRARLVDRGLLRRRRSLRPRLYPWLMALGLGFLAAGTIVVFWPVLADYVTELLPWLPGWGYFALGGVLLAWSTVLSAIDPGRLRTRAGRRLADAAEHRATARDRVGAVAACGLRGRVAGGLAVAGMFALPVAALATLPARHSVNADSCGDGCSSSSCGGGEDSASGCGGSSCGSGCGGGGGD